VSLFDAAGEQVATTTSGRNGRWRLSNLLRGTYTIKVTEEASLAPYSDTISVPRLRQFTANVSPSMPEGQVRLVLTWGQRPNDLDSHFWDPNGCETYYGRRYGCTGVSLDRDITSSYGPETITVSSLRASGTYKYRIRNYSRNFLTSMRGVGGHTPAEVVVYKGNAVLGRYSATTDGYFHGHDWYVFTMAAADATLTPCDSSCVQ